MRGFSTLLFDLDGVLTRTATVHARAWKRLFDEFLAEEAAARGEADHVPFDIEADYVRHVDGRRRYDGVATFLASRGIELPQGDPSDAPGTRTVTGLGNRKDAYFLEVVDREGVEVFADAVALLDALAEQGGHRMAVVSASVNCEPILVRVGLRDRFEALVTGVEAAALDLRGKPAPDTFLKGAELLGADPSQAVVLEDALSGVEAGRAGGFGLVVGVDRRATATSGAEMSAAGADVVVTDLTALLA